MTLDEVDKLNANILLGLSSEERANFAQGLKTLNIANPRDRIALRESIKVLRPDFTDVQLDIAVYGKQRPNANWIA